LNPCPGFISFWPWDEGLVPLLERKVIHRFEILDGCRKKGGSSLENQLGLHRTELECGATRLRNTPPHTLTWD
jgi:hypothetical protein